MSLRTVSPLRSQEANLRPTIMDVGAIFRFLSQRIFFLEGILRLYREYLAPPLIACASAGLQRPAWWEAWCQLWWEAGWLATICFRYMEEKWEAGWLATMVRLLPWEASGRPAATPRLRPELRHQLPVSGRSSCWAHGGRNWAHGPLDGPSNTFHGPLDGPSNTFWPGLVDIWWSLWILKLSQGSGNINWLEWCLRLSIRIIHSIICQDGHSCNGQQW